MRKIRACCVFFIASHAPPKPVVQVLGRHELMIQWDSPPKPLGRINSFEVRVDGVVSETLVYTVDHDYLRRLIVLVELH